MKFDFCTLLASSLQICYDACCTFRIWNLQVSILIFFSLFLFF
uniref:Uncharacterized protein n=1 Tax=Anguilla anguilla TaxID=7936 RepID=A0A0E9UCR3_ANGAN